MAPPVSLQADGCSSSHMTLGLKLLKVLPRNGRLLLLQMVFDLEGRTMAYAALLDASQQAAPCQQRHLLGHSRCPVVCLWLKCRGCCCLLKMPLWRLDHQCPQGVSLLLCGIAMVAGAVWRSVLPCLSPGGQDPFNCWVAVCRLNSALRGMQLVKGQRSKGSTPVDPDAIILTGTVSRCIASDSEEEFRISNEGMNPVSVHLTRHVVLTNPLSCPPMTQTSWMHTQGTVSTERPVSTG